MNSSLKTKTVNSAFNKDNTSNVTPPANKSQKSLAKPVLIINKHADLATDKENMKTLNKAMITGKVSFDKSFKNKLGNTVFVCSSVDSRDKLRDEIVKNIPDVSYKAPPPLRPVITVVGFDKECDTDDLNDAIVYQNHFIKDFLAFNNCELSDHVEHIATKPLKKNNDLSQALFRVSPAFRDLLQKFDNKITIGSMRCKIYDRHNLKRCNNCYDFGHFAAHCKSPSVCGKCASTEHETKDCTSKIYKCINCIRHNFKDINHPAFSHKCPCFN